MRYIPVILILLLIIPRIQGQPLQKYQGKMANGFTEAGDVTYSYRTDPKTGKQVRQGAFRYSVKAKDDLYRFSHNITGTYQGGLKEGIWSCKINQKDFMLQQPGLYTSGTVSLDAAYSKGLAHGKWHYESVLKNRSGEKVQDKWVWGKADSAETVVLDLNFTNGVITGPLYANVHKSYEVQGSFDENGFFDGEWVWRFPDSTITLQWDRGVQVRMEITDLEGNILHLDDQSHTAKMIGELQKAYATGGGAAKKAFSFSPDTISLLREPAYHLTKLLTGTIYHQHYSLYGEIDGDKSIFYDKQAYRMRYHIRGLYVIRPKGNISGMQVQQYNRMESMIGRMESQMAFIYQLKRGGKLNKQAGEAIRLMEFNIILARKYSCVGETLKLHMLIAEGMAASDLSCAWLSASMEKLPAFKSRDEALQYLVEKIASLEKENQGHYMNIRKNMVD